MSIDSQSSSTGSDVCLFVDGIFVVLAFGSADAAGAATIGWGVESV